MTFLNDCNYIKKYNMRPNNIIAKKSHQKVTKVANIFN